ncbi:MAG: ECF transporter S component [Oscillospiraceae bacterium]|nr:ECF transporter S component [Oscillospiraceae bacterium]
MQKNRSQFTVRRLVLNAVLIALYVVLGYMRIQLGNSFRISIAPFAVILCALAFGPIDGLIVGFMGEFLTQVLGPYGLTLTTPLWCLGETLRGFLLGLCAVLFMKKWRENLSIPTGKMLVLIMICCVTTGLISSFGNTFALYVDSKMLGYYSYAIVFGALLVRLLLSAITSTLLGYISAGIITALRKSKLI